MNIARADLSDDRLCGVRFVSAMLSTGGRIRAARKDAGLTQAELALRMGVTQSVVSDWENAKLASWSERETAEKLATALGKPRGYFAAPQAPLVSTTGIEVVGEVQAGVFRAALEIPPEDRLKLPVVTLGGAADVDYVALKVVGPSMNELYPDGSFVICIPTFSTDVRDGDRVVVYQRQGDLVEATIKEVHVEPGGRVGLWPRSTDPRYQDPIYLDADDQDGPEIKYVVVYRFAQEERPPPTVRWRRRA